MTPDGMTPDASPRPWVPGTARFGRFALMTGERRLTCDGVAVPLGGRAMDLLIRLVRGAGQTVSKAELSEAAWPGMVVEEGSLRFHIAALRRLLDSGAPGGSCLATVSGRGYCFTPPVVWSALNAPLPPLACALPPPPRNTVALEDRLAEAAAALRAGRLLTLVGPPGIGKTTMALRLGHHAAGLFPDGVALVDLAVLRDAASIPGAIAVAAGLARQGDRPGDLARLLAGRRLLLILDGCEHLIDAVADVAEGLLRQLPDLVVLATSRESLRLDGEGIFRLFPLACPPGGGGLGVEELLLYPAARLFVEHVRSASFAYRLTEAEVPDVVEICRRLDGIPLALELAAGCVPWHGVGGTARLLEGHAQFSWKGRRTAPPRHRTLGAALDWSYDLLGGEERKVLRRVSVFMGAFTAEAAAIVAGEGFAPGEVAQILIDLAAKSLVSLQEGGAGPCRYRLLDTMAAYGMARLSACGEAAATLARHADHARARVAGAEGKGRAWQPPADIRLRAVAATAA